MNKFLMYFHDYFKDPTQEYWVQEIYPDNVELTSLSENDENYNFYQMRPKFKRFGESKDFENKQFSTLAKCQFCGNKGWTLIQTEISCCQYLLMFFMIFIAFPLCFVPLCC